MNATDSNFKLAHFPVSFFSIVMGLSGFVLAVNAVSHAEKLESLAGVAVLPYVPLAVFALIAIVYALKVIKHPAHVREEFNHPVRLSFFPTITIGLALLSVVFFPIHVGLSRILCVLGGVGHLLFTLTILTRWINHTHFKIEHVNPAWFIPIVGNIVVPIAAMRHFHADLSWFFFSVGVVFWIQLATIIFFRKIFHEPVKAQYLPTLFILIAPPAVGFVSYTSIVGGVDAFARVLYFFALFTTLLVLTLTRSLHREQFYLSFWAYTFPIAAMSIASAKMAVFTGLDFYAHVGTGLLAYLTIVVLLLIRRTLIAVRRGELCVPAH